jgi:serine/threonine-protein kinase ULK/ATG1
MSPLNLTKNEGDDAKPYIMVDEIGKGSFAIVYKGYHEVRRIKPSVNVSSSDYRKLDTKLQSRPLSLTT